MKYNDAEIEDQVADKQENASYLSIRNMALALSALIITSTVVIVAFCRPQPAAPAAEPSTSNTNKASDEQLLNALLNQMVDQKVREIVESGNTGAPTARTTTEPPSGTGTNSPPNIVPTNSTTATPSTTGTSNTNATPSTTGTSNTNTTSSTTGTSSTNTTSSTTGTSNTNTTNVVPQPPLRLGPSEEALRRFGPPQTNETGPVVLSQEQLDFARDIPARCAFKFKGANAAGDKHFYIFTIPKVDNPAKFDFYFEIISKSASGAAVEDETAHIPTKETFEQLLQLPDGKGKFTPKANGGEYLAHVLSNGEEKINFKFVTGLVKLLKSNGDIDGNFDGLLNYCTLVKTEKQGFGKNKIDVTIDHNKFFAPTDSNEDGIVKFYVQTP